MPLSRPRKLADTEAMTAYLMQMHALWEASLVTEDKLFMGSGTEPAPEPTMPDPNLVNADDISLAVLKLFLRRVQAEPDVRTEDATFTSAAIATELRRSRGYVEETLRRAHQAEAEPRTDTDEYKRLRRAIVQVRGKFCYRPMGRWICNLWLSGVTPDQVLAYPYTTSQPNPKG